MNESEFIIKKEENHSEWYRRAIHRSDLAELSGVRGCMIIKPWGYAIWEEIQKKLNSEFKISNHSNVYFPLLIPKKFLERENDHVVGFAKECAIVTHSRLESSIDGGLRLSSELKEPFVIRPTSETVTSKAFSRWITSYRDLPVLINQWANIVRWEMRTRPFLRNSEFLWQEGHTAHCCKYDAIDEIQLIRTIYSKFFKNFLSIPFNFGEKTNNDKFPGAVKTFCFESMMRDRKSLQIGTIHFLGQNFSKSFNISFIDRNGERSGVWTTSWGVTTRLIGGLVMTHGDNYGIKTPPRLTPIHMVILPMICQYRKQYSVISYCNQLKIQIEQCSFFNSSVRVRIDDGDTRGGVKLWDWIRKGVPVWTEIGIQNMQRDVLYIGRRDRNPEVYKSIERNTFIIRLPRLLKDIQSSLYGKAISFSKKNTLGLRTKSDLFSFFTNENKKYSYPCSGFVICYWNGKSETENCVKILLSAAIRCIPIKNEIRVGECVVSREPCHRNSIFSKSY